MRLTTILFFLCAIASEAFAGSDSLVVFTPEIIDNVVMERSSDVRLHSLLVEDANQGVITAKDTYLPNINVSWEVGYLGNGYLTDRDFSSGMGIHNPHFVNNFAIEAMQIIYSGGAVSGSIRMAELKTHLANLSLDDSRQQIKFLILSKLIDLQCLYNQREVLVQNIELARNVLEQIKARVQQGVVLENDQTRYELQIANIQLQIDRLDENINVINSSISTTLSYPEGTRFRLQSEKLDENYPLQSLSDWQAQAATSNLAIKQAQLGIDLSQTRLKITNAERLPHINAFAYGNFNSPITIEVPVLNKNFMYWGFGINVSYNLSSLFKTTNKLKQASIGIMESEQQLELTNQAVTDHITQAYQAFMTAQSTLRTQRYSMKLAQQNYDIVSSRFDAGMALITDLVDAANVMIAAQTGIENAQSQLLFCLYRLKFIANIL